MSARTSARTRGFTLAEVAVTIVIVGIGMLLVLQGLNNAKMTAAHTRNMKLSRELALLTLGQVEAGLYQEDIENGLVGSYAEEGYPDFAFEVVVGDDSFRQTTDGRTFDSWADRDNNRNNDDEEDKKDSEEPFEKVKIRITSPKIGERGNELILEDWIPWKQVYGDKEEDKTASSSSSSSTSGTHTP